MRLIVGLGNPGSEYEWSRHNLGFMLIDKLAKDAQVEVRRRECNGLIGRTQIEGANVLLVKPQTYMNLSGQTVSCLLAKHASESESQLIVISDDLALPLGKIRIRERGSAGGHNGLKSIIGALGTEEFARLRVGVGRGDGRRDLADHVLAKFDPQERADVVEAVGRAADAAELFVAEGIGPMMNRFNRKEDAE